jgi:hypothetical protein
MADCLKAMFMPEFLVDQLIVLTIASKLRVKTSTPFNWAQEVTYYKIDLT